MSSNNLDPASTFSKKLRFLLSNDPINLESLARRVGFTRERLQFVVDGESKPTRHLVDGLCEVFGVRRSFFGKDIETILASEPAGNDSETAGSTLAKLSPIIDELLPKKRKFDLAELAAHHQALLECLFEKRVISPGDYEKKLEAVRARAGL